jgi:hypothetical protein
VLHPAVLPSVVCSCQVEVSRGHKHSTTRLCFVSAHLQNAGLHRTEPLAQKHVHHADRRQRAGSAHGVFSDSLAKLVRFAGEDAASHHFCIGAFVTQYAGHVGL